MYTGSGLELFAIAVVCKEVCISNSCPIFTLAAEQVVIHCITTAHQNAKLVSISSSRADRSYTFSLYFAHREQVQNLYFAHREQVHAPAKEHHNIVLCSPRASASSPGERQHTAASCEEAHRVLTHQSSGELSVSAKRWQVLDSNAETGRATICRLAQSAPITEQTLHRCSLSD